MVHGTDPFKRLLSASRKKSTLQLRRPWRTREKRVLMPLSPALKAKKKELRVAQKRAYQDALRDAHNQILKLAEGLRTQFGNHSTQYYMEEIMQISRLQKKKKVSGMWNAFVSMEVQRINSELPAGVPRKKVNDLIGEIGVKWASLSKEMKVSVTKEKLAALQETREMRDLASHNVPIAAFHDIRVTLKTIDEEVMRLHSRTGLEVLMMAVRGSPEGFNRAHVLTTSDRVDDFVGLTMNETVPDLGLRMEAYMLSGVKGVIRNYVQEGCRLKAEIAKLILGKLNEKANNTFGRMSYNNFDTMVTKRSGLVIKNWPLKKFCAPSEIHSRTELNILFNAWTSDTAHFYKLTREEFAAWERQHNNNVSLRATGDTVVALPSPTTPCPPDSEGSDIIHPMPAPTSDGSDIHHAPASTSALPVQQQPLTLNFVNTVSSNDGSMLLVTTKTRKTRKDKGTKRAKVTRTPQLVDQEN